MSARFPMPAAAATSVLLVALGLTVSPAVGRAAEKTPQRPASEASVKGCPELASLNPALVELPLEALESQLVSGSGLPPSAGKQYLEALRAQLSVYAPDRRECMYRVMLIQARGAASFVRRLPGNWGLDRPSPEIARSFLSLPMKRQLGREQREDLLAQVEEYVIPNLQAQGAGDREHWRRRYYGLLLTCEASEETLKKLEATRPTECLRFEPRQPPQPWHPAEPGASGAPNPVP